MNTKLRKGIILAVHKYLKNKGFTDIKADLQEMKRPKKIVEKQSGDIFQPDLTAVHNDASYLFEIEMGENIESRRDKLIRKCSILHEYATSRAGKLYLIVPIQKFDKVIDEVTGNNLKDIGILQINVE